MFRRKIIFADNDFTLSWPTGDLSTKELKKIEAGLKPMPKKYCLTDKQRVVLRQFLEEGVLVVLSGASIQQLEKRLVDLIEPKLRYKIIAGPVSGAEGYIYTSVKTSKPIPSAHQRRQVWSYSKELLTVSQRKAWSSAVDEIAQILQFSKQKVKVKGIMICLPEVRVDQRGHPLAQITIEADSRNEVLRENGFSKGGLSNMVVCNWERLTRSEEKSISLKEFRFRPSDFQFQGKIDIRRAAQRYLDELFRRDELVSPRARFVSYLSGTGALDTQIWDKKRKRVCGKETAIRRVRELRIIERILECELDGRMIELWGDDFGLELNGKVISRSDWGMVEGLKGIKNFEKLKVTSFRDRPFPPNRCQTQVFLAEGKEGPPACEAYMSTLHCMKSFNVI
jgi:hypothetical protein